MTRKTVWGTPPAKRAKRLPPGLTCECCGGPLRSLKGFWLDRGQYAVECKAGCWACYECGDFHHKDEICPAVPNADKPPAVLPPCAACGGPTKPISEHWRGALGRSYECLSGCRDCVCGRFHHHRIACIAEEAFKREMTGLFGEPPK